MKKLPLFLCVAVVIIAAALLFWPRLDIPEGVAVTLLSYGADFQRVHRSLEPEDCAELCRMLDGRPLLPDWTDAFTGQRFYLSAEIECGLFLEWEGGSTVLYLPKQGSQHLLHLAADDALIWLNSTELDALAALFEAQGVYYPPVITLPKGSPSGRVVTEGD